jgi:Uma2 family endonuclease
MATILTPPGMQGANPLPPAAGDFPDESKLISEDGKPVDSIYAEKQMRLLTEPLFANWKGPQSDGRFIAMANVGLYFSDDAPLVPDVLLSVDVVPPEGMYTKQLKSYFVWRYGKSPDVVVEHVSNKEGGEDSTKLPIYARWGVPYYVIFDPEHLLSQDTLRILALEKRRYHPSSEGYLEAVGLGLTLWKGAYENWDNLWLRWCDRDGDLILTGAERAEKEHRRADEEQRRAEKLLALLREKGIEPGPL